MRLKTIAALVSILCFFCLISFGQTAKPLSDRERQNKERFAAIASKFEGAEAVYREGAVFGIVRLTDVRSDDWGVRANVRMLSDFNATNGSSNRTWNISASWEILTATADIWHAQYVSWTIYFDKDLVAEVKALSAELSGQPGALRNKVEGSLLNFQKRLLERGKSGRQ